VKGYDVVTSDGQKIGRVTGVLDGFVVVQLGRLLRPRRPLPNEFAHAQDADRTVVVTVPKRVLSGAPQVHRNGTFDVDEAARHYGLASMYQQVVPLWPEKTPEHAPVERLPERVYVPGGK
jgi:hypothetical protein